MGNHALSFQAIAEDEYEPCRGSAGIAKGLFRHRARPARGDPQSFSIINSMPTWRGRRGRRLCDCWRSVRADREGRAEEAEAMAAELEGRGSASAVNVRRCSAGPMSDINVTPMVDVMLVLLIIFMVAVPSSSVGVDIDEASLPKVELPKTEAGPVAAPGRSSSSPWTLSATSFSRHRDAVPPKLAPKTRGYQGSRKRGSRAVARRRSHAYGML